MIDGKFDVVFRGQVIRNMDIDQVKANLVTMFKSTPEGLERLFGGNEVVVRKSLDYGTAMKYQSALKKAGALALIKEVEIAQEAESKPVARPEPVVTQSPGRASFTAVDKPAFGASSDIASNASSGSDINTKPDSQIQTRATAHSEPQSTAANGVVSKDTVVSNDDETTAGNYSLADAGAQIMPDKVYEKRNVDTSDLSLADAGERLLPKSEPEKHVQPSIDHLKLED